MTPAAPDILPAGGTAQAQLKRPVRRVLHVFDSLGVGGAETWLVALLEWFAFHSAALPFDVQFEICLTGSGRAILDDRIAALGAELHYVRYGRARIPSFVRDFRKLLIRGRYDAIHDHADFAGGIHLLCGVGALPPVRVVHIHSALTTADNSAARRIARRIGYHAVDWLATTVAGTSRAILREYGFADDARPQRRVALHCGFDVSRFVDDSAEARAYTRAEWGWAPDTTVLLFVGRFESRFPQKNPAFALEVARECITRNPNVRALFVGAGNSGREQLIAQTEAWGLADAFRFPGIRFDVPRLMLGADLLLFPSIAEGLGMVAVEAQAAGLRVLASDTVPRECEVVPEMVTFVSLAETSERWADRAFALLERTIPDAATCREAVARSPFSIESSARALLDVYGFGHGAAL